MDIEARLDNGKWTGIKIYSNEEELPDKDYADPHLLKRRIISVLEIVNKVFTFLLLVWDAIKSMRSIGRPSS